MKELCLPPPILGVPTRRIHMLRKAVILLGASLTLACGAFAVGVAPSGADSGSHCTFQHVPNLNPGVSYNSTSGTFIDPGGGTVKCSGAVSGSGDYTDSGTYSNATCQSGGAAGGDPPVPHHGPTLTGPIQIRVGQGPPPLPERCRAATFRGWHGRGTMRPTP